MNMPALPFSQGGGISLWNQHDGSLVWFVGFLRKLRETWLVNDNFMSEMICPFMIKDFYQEEITVNSSFKVGDLMIFQYCAKM